MQDQFIVMSGCVWPAQPSFAKNAICESRVEADEECRLRNLAESMNGNKGVQWFVCVHTVEDQKFFASLRGAKD